LGPEPRSPDSQASAWAPFPASPSDSSLGRAGGFGNGCPPCPAEPRLYLKPARSFDNRGPSGALAALRLPGLFWTSRSCRRHGDSTVRSRSYPGLLSPRRATARQNRGHPVHIPTPFPRIHRDERASALSAGITLLSSAHCAVRTPFWACRGRKALGPRQYFCIPTAIRRRAATQPPARVTVPPCSALPGPTQLTSCCSLGVATRLNQK